MGYSHYIYRPKEITNSQWSNITRDTKKVLDYLQNEIGIALAGGAGDGEPVIDADYIGFNGSGLQPIGVWTTSEEVSIPWPASNASLNEPVSDPIAQKTAGTWFAGTLLTQRVAPICENTGKGSGSYETCSLERTMPDNYTPCEETGLYFDCCKTAYRPYDLAVTAFYTIIRHHVPVCRVRTDGEEQDWMDAMVICHNLLGYELVSPLEDDLNAYQQLLNEKDNKRIQTQIEVDAQRVKDRLKGETVLTSLSFEYAIVAELREDQSDSMTDYFHASTVKKVYLAFSGHKRDLFSEMRKAAANFPETAHLKDAGKEFEHREKWSMGYGYYLGKSKYSGWIVSKEKISLSSLQLAVGEGRCFIPGIGEKSETMPILTAEYTDIPSKLAVKAIQYSEKAIAIYGNTKPIKEELKAQGGRFNKFLKIDGQTVAGWIFSAKNEYARKMLEL